MIDLDLIVSFDWDEGNAAKSAQKHGVSQAEAEQIFFNDPLLVVEDVKHSSDERRWHALGHTNDDRLLHVSFTMRDVNTKLRIISARDMNRKERALYDKDS